MPESTGSKPFSWSKEDYIKIGKGAAVALIGALSVYILQISDTVDFGNYDVWVAAGAATFANAVRKWIVNNS